MAGAIAGTAILDVPVKRNKKDENKEEIEAYNFGSEQSL